MTRPSTDHVVICLNGVEGNAMRCEHCTLQYTAPVPMPIDQYVEQAKGFALMHRRCIKPERPSPQLRLPHHDYAIDASTSGPAPEIDPPGPEPHPHQKFFDLYPLATRWATLLDDCSYGLTGEQFEIVKGLETDHWRGDSGQFFAVAEWARREHAHRDAQLRARDGAPAIAGLTLPARQPMPEPLATLLGGKPRKRAAKGARPLSSPKPRRKRGEASP